MVKENSDPQNAPHENTFSVKPGDAIVFPVDKSSFRDFMVSLLGKPELLEGYREGAFEIGFEHIKHLHDSLEQRILNQNDSVFIEFKANLYFEDCTEIQFNSIRNFLQYETSYQKHSKCIGFYFTWIYLVKFNNKTTPEKQEISIFKYDRTTKLRKLLNNSLEWFEFFIEDEELPQINYSIRHTNLKWSLEIESILQETLNRIFEIKGILFEFRKLLANILSRRHSLPLFFISLLISFAALERNEQLANLLNTYKENPDKILNLDIDLSKKTNFIINLLVAHYSDRTHYSLWKLFLCMFIVYMILYFAVFCLYQIIKLPTYEFILFNEYSKKLKKKYLDAQLRKVFFYCIGIVVSISCSVFASYIYTFLTK